MARLKPAVRYTYAGETVIDICRTPAGRDEHLAHLLANGYTDARPVVVADEDGTARVVAVTRPAGICPNCGDASPTYLHPECEADYLAYVSAQTAPAAKERS